MGKLFDINCNSTFLDLAPKAKKIKAKISNWDLIDLKSFCTAEEINKMKRQHTEWEKVYANNITGKELYVYKQLITEKQFDFKNRQKTWIDIFPERKCGWPTDAWKDTQHH